jgi:hypothetical protein
MSVFSLDREEMLERLGVVDKQPPFTEPALCQVIVDHFYATTPRPEVLIYNKATAIAILIHILSGNVVDKWGEFAAFLSEAPERNLYPEECLNDTLCDLARMITVFLAKLRNNNNNCCVSDCVCCQIDSFVSLHD